MPRARRRAPLIEQRICSILGCSILANVIIGMHGTDRVWYGCCSEHTRSIILDIRNKWPIRRGITMKGVNISWKTGQSKSIK